MTARARVRSVLLRVVDVLCPAPADMGLPEPDDLAVFTDADFLGLTAYLDFAPDRPHEGTAAERTGGVR